MLSLQKISLTIIDANGVIEMDFLIFCIKNFSLYDFTLLIGLICMVYFMIAPALFRFWIIPKVENRYGKCLIINDNDYFVPFSSWGMPPLELSSYIVCKYLNLWEPPGIKKPREKTLTFKLKEINYDVNMASNAEIVLGFLTILSIMYFFIVIGGISVWCSLVNK